jgi:serine/threonine-protein kinase
MTRPQTAQDVFDSLGQNRLAEAARLEAFLGRHQPAGPGEALELLVAEGVLTEFQAEEVAHGRAAALWMGGYKLLDRLGKGAMGSVYLAEHAVLGRRVAVKALSEALRADPGARKRFVREARAAASLDHPNIVRVFDVNMNNDPPYLVMEYVDGVSLQAAVARFGTFSAGEAAAVGVQVADGLVQAAAVGLVHRDIKPANLLVDRRGAAKILDLGIVRFAHDDTMSRVNGAEIILGTVDYLAPEQAEDCTRVDFRADIYSLGATLYFLLAGHPPYPVADVRQKLAAKRSVDPPPVHDLRPDVPEDFSALLCRLMARDPAVRIPSPAAAVAALHPWATPGPDFPGRLFRPAPDTASPARRLTDHEPAREQLPDTVRILKAGARRSGSEPPPGERPPPPVFGGPPVYPPDESGGPGEAPPDHPPTAVVESSAHTGDTQGVGCGGSLTDEIVSPPGPGEPPTAALPEFDPPPREELAPALPRHDPPPRRGLAVKLVLGTLALAAALAALLAR